MKYKFMLENKDEFSVERMSKVFNVSRSGFYQFITAKPPKRLLEEKQLLIKIQAIHEKSRKTYGSPRIHAELAESGETCSRPRVARLMKKAGIVSKMKKRFKVTTKVDPRLKAAPNLLKQDFSAKAPNQRWAADLTYIWTQEGWLYVAVVLDLFSRRIVGLSMSHQMNAALVLSALNQAVLRRRPSEGLVHHSDRGSQYTSQAFQDFLLRCHILPSMSSTGNCYDNAAMESFFHTLKTEHVYGEYYLTRQEAKQSIFEYIEVFYNQMRRHSTLGYSSPAAFENHWVQTQGVSILSVY